MPRPAHHLNATKNSFQNPWGAHDSAWNEWSRSISSIARLPFSLAWDIPDSDKDLTPPTPVKVISPDFSLYDATTEDKRIVATWLGHASFLARLPGGINILFDPMFSPRASPSVWVGPARRLPSPCTVSDLPRIHYVVVSHDHYDHCDIASIDALHKKQAKLAQPIRYLVPLGIKALLLPVKIPQDHISELDWWESVSFPVNDAITDGHNKLQHLFTCLPAQHNSGRSFHDHGSTLWAGWAVQEIDGKTSMIKSSIYFAGDTGFLSPSSSGGPPAPCPAFTEIGERMGPFDVAIIPIWRGASLSFLSRWGLRLSDAANGTEPELTTQESQQHDFLRHHHATPEDALSLSVAVRARHSLASHFATFAGSDGEALEPIVRLKKERRGDWDQDGGFGWLDVGGTAVIESVEREANDSLIKDT